MKTLRSEAHAFMVWRIGNSVKWQCTIREIAEELGMSEEGVGHICRKRGWRCQSERGLRATGGHRVAVDHAMREGIPKQFRSRC